MGGMTLEGQCVPNSAHKIKVEIRVRLASRNSHSTDSRGNVGINDKFDEQSGDDVGRACWTEYTSLFSLVDQ